MSQIELAKDSQLTPRPVVTSKHQKPYGMKSLGFAIVAFVFFLMGFSGGVSSNISGESNGFAFLLLLMSSFLTWLALATAVKGINRQQDVDNCANMGMLLTIPALIALVVPFIAL